MTQALLAFLRSQDEARETSALGLDSSWSEGFLHPREGVQLLTLENPDGSYQYWHRRVTKIFQPT